VRRRDVLRLIGQLVAQILIDIEENVIGKTRRALLARSAALLRDSEERLVCSMGKDDFFFLEHYVLLGNYARDPDRQEPWTRSSTNS